MRVAAKINDPAADNVCRHCGRPLADESTSRWAEMDNGGRWVVGETIPESESLGSFPIGPDCYRAIQKEAGR